jgi:hypothetical protein
MDWGALLQALRLRRRLMGFLAILASPTSLQRKPPRPMSEAR